MATILEVAKLAGVSKSTVSRVINDSGPIKEETKKRVEKAMKELNYSPSYFAQGIRTGKTKTIAMLVPDYTNVYYADLFRGVEDIARNHGYMVLVCNTDESPDREIEYAKELLKRNIDGIIYNTYENNSIAVDYFINLSNNMPVVFLDNVLREGVDFPYVLTEGKNITKKAVEYLIAKGRKRIAYIRMPPHISVVQHRYEGYKQAILESSLEFDNNLVYQCHDNHLGKDHLEIGKEGAEYFMSLDNPPDAIVATVDIMAVGVIKYLNANGYKIPNDVSVIGYDNISLSTIIEPSLTTIAQPTRKIGQEAARILIDKINGVKNCTDQIIFEPEFIIREST